MLKDLRHRLVVRKCASEIHWRLAFILLTLIITSVVWAADETSNRLMSLKLELRKDFPEIKHISIADFFVAPDNTVLVDVRTEEEFRISRVPGAIHIDDPDKLLAFATEHANESIVLYCSVGVRSSEATRLLQDHGFKNVANLEGSIFEWANEGRPLVNNQGATNVVHPYNIWWGWRYLSPEVRKSVDASHIDGDAEKDSE